MKTDIVDRWSFFFQLLSYGQKRDPERRERESDAPISIQLQGLGGRLIFQANYMGLGRLANSIQYLFFFFFLLLHFGRLYIILDEIEKEIE